VQGLQTWFETAPDDVVVLDVVVENSDGEPASVADAQLWRDSLEIDFTVLADSDEQWVDAWGNGGSRRFVQHSYTVVGTDGRVAWHDEGHSSGSVDAIIEAAEAAE
jgi:peroxiredoxin